MSPVRRSILYSAAEKYLTQLLAIVTMAVMARLLTPEQTGLYLIAGGTILLAEASRDFAIVPFLIRQPELSRSEIRTAFSVTLVLSVVLGAALYLLAEWLATSYGAPDLKSLLQIGSLGFLLVPFGTPVMALIRRELDFGTLTALNVAGAGVAAVVTVGLAIRGVGPASYIWGALCGNAVSTLLAIGARPHLWIYRPSLNCWRQVLSFGAISSSVMLLNMGFDILPRFVLGHILGFDAVGLYGRAVSLCQIPERTIVSAFGPVVLPAFAERVRAQRDLKEAYLRGVTLMTAVQWPILLLVALLAEPLVALMLGAQWHAAAPLTCVMAIGTMALAPAYLTFPVLVAVGRVRDTLTASLISLPPSALVMVSVAHLGLDAVAASLLVTAPLQMAVGYHFVRRAIGLRWGDLWRAAAPSAFVTTGAMLLPLALVAWQPAGVSLGISGAVVAVAGAGLGWLAAGFCVAHPLLGELRQLAELVSLRMRRRA